MAIVKVNETSGNNGGNTNTSTATFTAATAGNLLVVVFSLRTSPQGAMSTPSGWTLAIQGSANADASSPGAAIFYKIAAGGETSVATTSSVSASDWAFWAAEYSGMASSSVLDVTVDNDTGSSVTSLSSGTTSSTSQASTLAIAACAVYIDSSAPSFNNSFTLEDSVQSSVAGGGDHDLYIGTRELTSTGTVTTTCSWTTARRSYHGLAVFKAGASATTATAENATATGTAYNATITAVPVVAASAGNATGTGTAYNASVAITKAASAEAATGTGTAYNATVSTTVAVTASAEAATGTGTANSATVALAVSAEVATGTGTANSATVAVTKSVAAEVASGTGTAYNATVTTTKQVSAEAATGTGTAYNATVSTATSVTVNAEAAAGTGTAYDATVAAVAVTTVNAEVAIATGTANNVMSGLFKGVGRPRDASGSDGADVQAVHAGWFYDWWCEAESVEGVEYVPMLFFDYELYSTSTPAQIVADTGTTTLLGFNEPDYAVQANMTVARALELWPDLEATGCRLGSPAVSAGVSGPAWLADFMGDVSAPHVDFICAHWYPDFSPDALDVFLDDLYSTYGLPIWLTEVGDLTGGLAANAALVDDVMEIVRARPFVERVAWFATRDADGWTGVGLLTSGYKTNFYQSGSWPGIWSNYAHSSGASSTSVSGVGRQTTGTIGGYGDFAVQLLDDLLTADDDLYLELEMASTAEAYPYLQFRSDATGANCYELQFRPAAGQVLFRRRVSGTYTTLTTITPGFSAADVAKIRIATSGSSISVKVWKNADSEPGSATFADSSGTHSTQKRFLLGLAGGSASSSRTCDWKNLDFGADPGGDLTVIGDAYSTYQTTLEYIPADNANAECATATGTAYDATISYALTTEGGAANGTGTANDAAVSVEVQPSTATGTGTALNPLAAATVNAGVATGAGTANDATVTAVSSITATAEAATGTGTALNPLAATTVSAESASSTATAYDATIATTKQVSAEGATGTGTANDALPAATVNAEAATTTGTAYDATVQTATSGSVSPDQGAGIGTAYDATVAIGVAAEVATATGTAHDATVTVLIFVTVDAGVATGTGSAYDALAAVTVNAEVAAAVGTAYDKADALGATFIISSTGQKKELSDKDLRAQGISRRWTGSITATNEADYSLIKESGSYVRVQEIPTNRILAAEAFYQGGRNHRLTSDEAADLISAGYGSMITYDAE